MIKIKHFIVLIPLLLLVGCNSFYSVDYDVSEQMENQIIEELKTSNERLTFNRIEIEVKRAAKKVLFYGIKNNLSVETTFNIDVSCNKDIYNTPNYISPVTFETFEQRTIRAGDIDVLKMNAIIPSEATHNTHMCHMVVTSEGNEYATKKFFITIP